MGGIPERCDVIEIEHGAANALQVIDWVTSKRPEVLLLYGSSIIREPFLSTFEGRDVKLHWDCPLNIEAPGPNFWPLVDGEPECVVTTVHLATLQVDAGGILAEARPAELAGDEGVHEMGSKAIMSGIRKMAAIVPRYLAGSVFPIAQDRSLGQLRRRKDLTVAALNEMHANFDRGMMREYLGTKESQDAAYPKIS